MAYLGALEAGGTKMVCAVGREDGSIVEQVSIPTTEPSRCMPQILEFFRGKGKRPGFFFIHLPEHRKHSPDVPVMLGSDEKL